MKTLRTLLSVTLFTLLANPAFAVDTTRVYTSGILIFAFLGFLALILLVQLVPTIMMVIGMVKGLINGAQESHKASATAAHRN
jgi:hypothetical protein